jgi:hypothetical protein
MSKSKETLELDISALGEPSNVLNARLIQIAFSGEREEEKALLPIVIRMQEAWDKDEAERIFAFFLRDNSHIEFNGENVRSFLGLNTLEWGEPMMRNAIQNDDFAKMLLMMNAGYNLVEDDFHATFYGALAESRFAQLLILMIEFAEQVTMLLESDWPDVFVKLTQHSAGQDYLAGQVLLGLMQARHPSAFEAGLPRAVDGYLQLRPDASSRESIEDYLKAMAGAFHPDVVPSQLVMMKIQPAWENY